MHTLPPDVTPYRTIGPFDESSIPKGLFKEHSTKAGVWGLLRVQSGSIAYHITQPGEESSHVLTHNSEAVIAPEQVHHLELLGPVTLTVTFLSGGE